MSSGSYLFLDTLREITKTKGRFITLTLLTMLGVGCFIGFRGITPSMELWRENLLEHQNTMDVEIHSFQGFSEEHVERLSEELWVERAEGVWVVDGYLEDSVVKIHSYSSEHQLNQLILTSGSFFTQPNQCLVESSFLEEYEYQIGDIVTILSLGVSSTEFEIVGTVLSPLFLSEDRGSSSLGVGEAEYYVYVSDSLFLGDYSQTYLKFSEHGQDNLLLLEELGEMLYQETLTESLEEQESEVASLINLWNVEKSWQHENLIQLEINVGYSQEVITKEWKEFQENLPSFSAKGEEQERLRIQELEEIYAQSLLSLEEAQIKAEAILLSVEKSIEQGQRDYQLLKNGQWTVVSLDEVSGYQDYIEDGQRLEQLAYGFPLVFLVVSLLLCWATMFHMVQGERVAIGTLRCLGYHSWEIALKYVAYSGLAGVFGSILGLMLGLKVIPSLVYAVLSAQYVLGDWTFYPHYTLSATTTVSFFSLLCLWGGLGAVASLRETPARLLRPRAPSEGGRIFLEKSHLLWMELEFHQQVTMRNLFRNPKRVVVTIGSLSVVTAVVVSAYGLSDAVDVASERQYNQIYLHSTQIKLRQDVTRLERMEVQGMLSSFGLSDSYTPFYSQNVTAKHSEINLWQDTTLYVVENREMQERSLNLRQNRFQPYYMPETGVVMPLKLAEELNLELGDYFTLEGDFGTITPRVTALSEHYTEMNLYMMMPYYETITGEEETVEKINEFWVDYEKMNSNKPENWNLLDEKLTVLDGVQWINQRSEEQKNYTESIKLIDYTNRSFLLFSALLTYIVLSYLSHNNRTSRLGELSTLKVLGFTDYELSAYLYRENIILTFYGIVVGMVLGQLFHHWLVESVELPTEMLYRGVNVYRFLAAAGTTAVLALLVNLVDYVKLKGLDMKTSFRTMGE